MNEWNIQSRAHACQACHKAFADKEAYYTLLFDQKRGLERFDVCGACWKSQYGQGANDRKGFVSFWQGLFTVPAPAAPDPILKETAESLLRRLLEQNDPQFAATCYILGAMLERKRLLKSKARTQQDGQDLTVYEHGKTGELFTILDPHLQLNQLEEVQQQVSRLLQQGVASPADAAPSVAMESEANSAIAPLNHAEPGAPSNPSSEPPDASANDLTAAPESLPAANSTPG